MPYQDVPWPDKIDLARLVRAAQHDGDRAVDDLLTTLRPSLLAFFTDHVAFETAEDLTQVALARVTGALPRIDPQRAGVYLITVARNLLRTTYRRRERDATRYTPVEPDTIPDSESQIAADVLAEYEELVQAVHRVSHERLPAEVADVILGLMRGETTSEIAARQGVSPITVRTRLLRARTVLRQELRTYLGDKLRRDSSSPDTSTRDVS